MLALQALAHPDFMFWGAALPADTEFSLEDPLALDYINQQIGYLLLPALTTRSGHAQYFAIVLYGLELVERAIRKAALPDDDGVRRKLFERWERFWALACLESRKGAVNRSDPDAMRGVRGAKKAWSPGPAPLTLEYTLISRQQELGGLGAYLAPLRNLELVRPGTLHITTLAGPIVDAFWGEADAPGHGDRLDNWALEIMSPTANRVERKHQGVRLATVGERSRLTSILGRKAQQDRLYKAIVADAPPPTAELAALVRSAHLAGIEEPRDILQALLDGRVGPVMTELRGLVALAQAHGAVAVALRDLFDAIYRDLVDTGGLVSRAQIAANAVTEPRIIALRDAAAALLADPGLFKIRGLPAHGAAYIRLLEQLVTASRQQVLDLVLGYHRQVQRARSSGSSWIGEQDDSLRADLTNYTGHRFAAPFPAYKLNILANLLRTTGHLPSAAVTQPESEEVEP